MATLKPIIPHLWFEQNPEDAVKFYTSVFKNSKIGKTSYFTEEGFEIHHQPAGSVLTIEFEIDGNKFIALNGGPGFKFNEAVSFMIPCKDQKEIDYYWNKLSDGGEEQDCGWLKDKYGLSWQVVPEKMIDWVADKDKKKVARLMKAQFTMKKFDIETLEKAFNGELVEV